MNGLFIINNFLSDNRFNDIYTLLLSGAEKCGIKLACRRSGDLLHSPDSLCNLPYDFILFWDKDTVLAAMLESCGYPVFNSSDAIFNCDNKALTFIKLKNAGLPVPETYASPITFDGIGYNEFSFAERISEQLSFPLVLKEVYGSFGQQVYLIENNTELKKRLSILGSKSFIMQKFISSSAGRDVRINVIGENAVSSILRCAKNGDFRSNITNGGTAKQIDPPPEWKAAAIAACKAVGAEFAGVDIMFGDHNQPIICEVNSNPHFRGSLDCTGVDLSPLIFRHIKSSLRI